MVFVQVQYDAGLLDSEPGEAAQLQPARGQARETSTGRMLTLFLFGVAAL